MSKKVLILGATGRTGKWVVHYVLKHGYSVHVLVRDKTKLLPNANISIFEGLPTDKGILRKAAAGCTAILSVLNISRTTDFPWSRLRTSKTFLSDTMTNSIAVAKEHAIKRIVVCSAWGVSDTSKAIPFWFRWIIQYSNIGVAYKDHERQEQLLKASDVEYTIVRPSGLTNSKELQTIRVSYNNSPKPRLTVSRKSLAKFMVGTLADDAFVGKCATVSKEG